MLRGLLPVDHRACQHREALAKGSPTLPAGAQGVAERHGRLAAGTFGLHRALRVRATGWPCPHRLLSLMEDCRGLALFEVAEGKDWRDHA